MNQNQRLIAFIKNATKNRVILGLQLLVALMVVVPNALEAKPAKAVKLTIADVIKGTVTDTKGDVLPGASVTVKGQASGTSTNEKGEFSITADAKDILVVSFIGYETLEVPVNGRTTIKIQLKDEAAALSEVVVIGYGTANKRDLTGSIVKIGGDVVTDKPNTNPVASLQGRVAGLSIVNNGTPGKAPDIRIRGTVSIGSVNPLYVVDGVFNDNIDYINPNDIESIEILKDPSSLAIFGVRGAAGVILVSTKKAKTGQITVNFNSSVGFKTLVDKIQLADAATFKELYEEEKRNIGVDAPFDYSKWTGNTDWIDAVTRTGRFNANNLTISSSSEKNRVNVGFGYVTDEGIIKHQKLEKLIFSINDELKLNNAFKIGFNLNALKQKSPYTYAENVLDDARKVAPIVEPFNEATGLYSALPPIQTSGVINPLLRLENEWDKNPINEFRTVGSIFGEVNFLKNFNFKATLYADLSQINTKNYTPIYSAYDATSGAAFVYSPLTSLSERDENYRKFQQDYILNYKRDFGKHGLNAMAGWTTYYFGYAGRSASVKQSPTGAAIPDDPRFWFIDNGFGDASSRVSSSSQFERATASALLRLLYDFDGKYFLNASYRKDGSSQISPNNRWQDFWAVGAAWDITREEFMKSVTFFNLLKLKASIGVLGNQNTYGYNYPYYPGLQAGVAGIFGNNIYPAYSQAYLPNPNLKWETVNAKEIGVEFNAINNRLHGEISYFDKTTNNLMTYIPGINGAQNGLDNIGKINNNGIELAASWNQNLTNDLQMTISGNLTTYNNKVLELATKDFAINEGPNRTSVGYPIGYFYGYIVEGVYQSYAEKLKSPVVTDFVYGPGDLKYKDVNGDGKISPDDRTMIGNPTPDFTYGGNITFKYKGFDLGVDVNGVYGNEIFRNWGSVESPFQRVNYPAFKENRWTGSGTSNWDPILGQDRRINYERSTYAIEDGSYFRIRNLQLGYNFDPKFISKLKMRNARLFFNVQNLKTFKNNSGYTPEFGGNALSFGVDYAGGAIPRTTTFGLNVTF